MARLIETIDNGPRSSNKTIDATIIVDGIHSWHAFQERRIKEIPAVELKDRRILGTVGRTLLPALSNIL